MPRIQNVRLVRAERTSACGLDWSCQIEYTMLVREWETERWAQETIEFFRDAPKQVLLTFRRRATQLPKVPDTTATDDEGVYFLVPRRETLTVDPAALAKSTVQGATVRYRRYAGGGTSDLPRFIHILKLSLCPTDPGPIGVMVSVTEPSLDDIGESAPL